MLHTFLKVIKHGDRNTEVTFSVCFFTSLNVHTSCFVQEVDSDADEEVGEQNVTLITVDWRKNAGPANLWLHK